MVQNSDTELNDTQQQQLYSLLLRYGDIFATNHYDFGHTDVIRHHIDTGDTPPIRQCTRRLPPAQLKEARNLLNEMLTHDIIQPSSSP